ncbi:(S)-1-Phenylethanol dehydrogenase [uncultured Desulfobacterium sp.]|jgi:3-oxoacyl-[acyl-carrier protein] reductase|uniref:(S)-1-Phenylethanol dehydrogenase n=1 Tax=uncultured Desulfobacterium sp. TaxID=201089 RepID=A0A445MSF4_9BACT|nr:(S)-1-Phenylethanol dehydrogenase [uncultured Desulfobacterium sp.]
MRLKDKVAIITGGGQGLGKEYAVTFCKEGAKVVIADINIDNAKEVEKTLIDMGGEALAVKVDVSKSDEVFMMAEKTVEKFGKIDVLVNNAAIYYGVAMKPFDTISEEEWERMFNVNVKGMWLCIKAAAPYMKQNGKGKIINISSGTWLMGIPMLLHYVTTKAAVVGMTRALSRELGEYGVCVNSISPGFTMTEASKTLPGRPPGLDEMMAQQTALGRNTEPTDLVGAAVFLASDASDFITGQMINVDGGCAMH